MTKTHFGSIRGGGSAVYSLDTLNDETPEQRRAAALTVCDRATDPGDARRLLQALGLVGGVGMDRGADGRHAPRPVVREGAL